MKKVIIIGILLVLSIASNVFGANECASTLSNDLKLLHIPALSFSGNLYLLDIEYVSTTDGFIWFKYTNISASTVSDCGNPASLFVDDSSKYILRVPLIFLGTTSFWLDLVYVPTTDGLIWFKVTNANFMSNWVFVTSVQGNGNLGSWADAGGKTGIDAGDAICQARANAAGLTGTFKAWLSDDNNDAYCRIHNLTGKKSANCGQATLPVAAGPWVRTDGFPFGASIDKLLDDGIVYAPARTNEYGQLVEAWFFSNTSPDGTPGSNLFQSPCSNWTSNSGEQNVGLGSTDGTERLWTMSASTSCSAIVHLLCFQIGAGPSLPQFSSIGKKAFLTSVTGNGSLSSWLDAEGKTGLAAGDAICKARAAAAGLANSNNFKAWLSDSTTNAKDRLISNGPWIRLDGIKVADNKTDLTDGTIFTSINMAETGIYYNFSNSWVWTGTANDGIKKNNTCNDWTNGTNTVKGTNGFGTDAGESWSSRLQFDSSSCDALFRLYCFED